MANTQFSTFSLQTLATLSGNSDDIFQAVAYYETWRPLFTESLKRLTGTLDASIARAYIDGDKEKIQKLFTEFLGNATILPQKEGMLIVEHAAPAPDESQISQVGRTFEKAQTDISNAQKIHTQHTREAFIHTLVEKYARTRPDMLNAQGKSILDEIDTRQKAEPTKSAPTIIEEIIKEKAPGLSNQKRIAQDIEMFVKRNADDQNSFGQELGQTILSSPDPEKASRFITDVLSSPRSPGIRAEDLAAHANGVVAGSIALSSSGDTRTQIANKVGGEFFSTISQTLTQRSVWAPLADTLGNIVGKGKVVEDLYDITLKKMAESLKTSFGTSEKNVNSIGSALFSSDAFKGLIIDAQKHIADTSGGGSSSLLSPARSFVDGIIQPIFAKPLEESVISYMYAVYIQKIPVSVAMQQYYLMMPAATPQPQGGGLLSWIFQLGKDQAIEAAAKAGAQKLAGTAIGATAKTAITVGGAATGPWGWAIAAAAWLGPKIIQPVMGFLKGIFSSLSGGALNRFINGGFESPEGRKELAMLSLMAIVPIAVIVVISVFPTLLNGRYVTQNQYDLAFINDAVNGMGGGLPENPPDGEHTPLIDCQLDPENPMCHLADCSSPVMVTGAQGGKMWPASGVITQGPKTTCGDTSHGNLDAIDIGAASGTSVYATTNGVILESGINSTCQDDVHSDCGGGYGNFVKIRSDNGYTLLFSHLMQSSLSSLQPGMRVSPQTSIGRVDDNGYSTGPHLHFGYMDGPGNINDILPASIGACSNNTPGCDSCGTPVAACTE